MAVCAGRVWAYMRLDGNQVHARICRHHDEFYDSFDITAQSNLRQSMVARRSYNPTWPQQRHCFDGCSANKPCCKKTDWFCRASVRRPLLNDSNKNNEIGRCRITTKHVLQRTLDCMTILSASYCTTVTSWLQSLCRRQLAATKMVEPRYECGKKITA